MMKEILRSMKMMMAFSGFAERSSSSPCSFRVCGGLHKIKGHRRFVVLSVDVGEKEKDEKRGFQESLIVEKDREIKPRRSLKNERYSYLLAAMASSSGITAMAAASVYYRFSWQMQGGQVPVAEMIGTFSLAVGATIGMEAWARWAHRTLWHESLWSMHQSHHRTREGPFELNDVFAIINSVPAIGLMAYGFLNKGFFPGLCFGAGLGITVYGMAYMFVHDGLVHKRFPVGPIARVPYLQKVAAAHQLHHSNKFNGIPFGLFFGPHEIEEVGGGEELQKIMKSRNATKILKIERSIH